MSPTKIRHSIATHLTAVRSESVDTVATNMMKNRPSTTAKFYVQHWNNREALRLAMHCHEDLTSLVTSTTKPLSTPTHGSDVVPPPAMEQSQQKIKEWLTNQEDLAMEDFNENIGDDHLETILEGETKTVFYFLSLPSLLHFLKPKCTFVFAPFRIQPGCFFELQSVT